MTEKYVPTIRYFFECWSMTCRYSDHAVMTVIEVVGNEEPKKPTCDKCGKELFESRRAQIVSEKIVYE